MRLNHKVDDIYLALSNCIQQHCVSRDDLALLATRDDLNLLLLNKVDKQHVVGALQRKATKQDVQGIDAKVQALAMQVGEMHQA